MEEKVETELSEGGLPELEMDVKMSVSLLYDYLLRHAYTTAAGLIGTCFGVASLMLFAAWRHPAYLVMGILMLVYLPFTLWRSAASSMVSNPVYKAPLHYVFTGEGFKVSQGETENSISWDGCIKAVSTRKSIIIYTGKNNASIFPRTQIPGGAEALLGLIGKYMEPKRVKIRY